MHSIVRTRVHTRTDTYTLVCFPLSRLELDLAELLTTTVERLEKMVCNLISRVPSVACPNAVGQFYQHQREDGAY